MLVDDRRSYCLFFDAQQSICVGIPSGWGEKWMEEVCCYDCKYCTGHDFKDEEKEEKGEMIKFILAKTKAEAAMRQELHSLKVCDYVNRVGDLPRRTRKRYDEYHEKWLEKDAYEKYSRR
jgi:hypothetical protein